MTTGCRSTSFPVPPRPSPYASHRHTTPVPPMRERPTCHFHPPPESSVSIPSMREHKLLLYPVVIGNSMPVPPMHESKLRNAMLTARDTSPSPSGQCSCFLCRALHRVGPMDQFRLPAHAAISCTASFGSPYCSGFLAQLARTTHRSSRQPVVDSTR